MIKRILTKLGINYSWKPIASTYVGFSTRDIVYESNCGKRKLIRVSRSFSKPFPFEPERLLSGEEIQDILNYKADRGILEQAMLDLGISPS